MQCDIKKESKYAKLILTNRPRIKSLVIILNILSEKEVALNLIGHCLILEYKVFIQPIKF